MWSTFLGFKGFLRLSKEILTISSLQKLFAGAKGESAKLFHEAKLQILLGDEKGCYSIASLSTT